MNQPDMLVEVAFETLRSALERAAETAWENVGIAQQSKNPDNAQQALDHTKALHQLLQQLVAFRSEFEDCVGLSIEPAVSADSNPSNDDIVKPVGRRSRPNDPNVTSLEEYYVPILEALVTLGGQANLNDVLDLVYERMRDRLTEKDCELLPSDRDFRWRNKAPWARYDMCQAGLLRNNSPRGVWEISEEGYNWLEKHYS